MYQPKKQFFSERNGYRIPDGQLSLECVPKVVDNAILSAFDRFSSSIRKGSRFGQSEQREFCEYLWTHFFHRSLLDLTNNSYHTALDMVERAYCSSKNDWYTKLDFIEAVLDIAKSRGVSSYIIKEFISELNNQFESLHYGYRIVKDNVVAITSEIEIEAIETAINDSEKPVQDALQQALSAHCSRPDPDYAGSMKNSISAVEIECYRLTGEKSLGPALSKLKKKGFPIHPQLEAAFQNLYNYSNDEKTGIRHGKKVDDDTFVPQEKESLFMLVACSAFINYLHSGEIDNHLDPKD